MYDTLQADKDFFDLFVDFKGFVDFFYLQDCVNEKEDSIIFWFKDDGFTGKILPETVDEYVFWLNHNLEFVKRRNIRIQKAIKNK